MLGGGRGFSGFVGHLGDFQRREQLAFAYTIANIYLDGLQISRDFGHDVDFLKGLKFTGQIQVCRKIIASHLHDGDGRWALWGGCFLPRRLAMSGTRGHDDHREDQWNTRTS